MRWQAHFVESDLKRYEKQVIVMEWHKGPDSLTIRFGGERPKNLRGCFLNINALDSGIEVDRIAKICVPEDAILLDGELFDNKLLDRPIGLFRIDQFTSSALKNEHTDFFPNILFRSGCRQPERDVERIIQEFVAHLEPDSTKEKLINEWERTSHKFSLCPVTNRIIRRELVSRQSTALHVQHQRKRHEKRPLPVSLQQEIVDVLTTLPNIETLTARQGLVHSAVLDRQLRSQFDFSMPSAQFFQIFVPMLHDYGKLEDHRNPLQAVLEAAKGFVGQEGRTRCEILIEKIERLSEE